MNDRHRTKNRVRHKRLKSLQRKYADYCNSAITRCNEMCQHIVPDSTTIAENLSQTMFDACLRFTNALELAKEVVWGMKDGRVVILDYPNDQCDEKEEDDDEQVEKI